MEKIGISTLLTRRQETSQRWIESCGSGHTFCPNTNSPGRCCTLHPPCPLSGGATSGAATAGWQACLAHPSQQVRNKDDRCEGARGSFAGRKGAAALDKGAAWAKCSRRTSGVRVDVVMCVWGVHANVFRMDTKDEVSIVDLGCLVTRAAGRGDGNGGRAGRVATYQPSN